MSSHVCLGRAHGNTALDAEDMITSSLQVCMSGTLLVLKAGQDDDIVCTWGCLGKVHKATLSPKIESMVGQQGQHMQGARMPSH